MKHENHLFVLRTVEPEKLDCSLVLTLTSLITESNIMTDQRLCD